MSEFDPETASLQEIEEEVLRRTGLLIEANASLINNSRRLAKAFLDQADVYRDLADECEEIAATVATAARRVADVNGDIISAEWGLASDENNDSESEEEEDDDDDD